VLPRLPIAGPTATALGVALLLLSLSGAQAPVDQMSGVGGMSAPGGASAVGGGAPQPPIEGTVVAGPPAAGDRVEQAPVRVRIPALGLDSELAGLALGPDGALVPPTDFARAGWFTESPVPGDVGPAVIAGHVDSYEGPAVFFRLRDLAPGDEVLVDLTDGTTVRFVVTGSQSFPKDRFPTERVYGPTTRAELRLITCGGEFDTGRRSYRDNVVVTAVVTS
jgi:hypothetical protein